VKGSKINLFTIVSYRRFFSFIIIHLFNIIQKFIWDALTTYFYIPISHPQSRE